MAVISDIKGTSQNTFAVGDGSDGNKLIQANIPGAAKPTVRYNATSDKWEYSHNGADFFEFGVLLTLSRLEQEYGEYLMPADGFTSVHLGGLFDVDSNGDLMPATGSGPDTFLSLDVNDDIQPNA